jgi:hypothetical protein
MKWTPPPEGHMKLNVDGVVEKTKNKGVVGVVCRDNVRVFQGASVVVVDGRYGPHNY